MRLGFIVHYFHSSFTLESLTQQNVSRNCVQSSRPRSVSLWSTETLRCSLLAGDVLWRIQVSRLATFPVQMELEKDDHRNQLKMADL